MSLRERILPRAGLAVAGAVGAGLSIGVAALFGGFGGNTTTIREIRTAVASSAAPAAFTRPGKGLTIEQIYARYAPGVVQITTSSTGTDVFGNPVVQGQALGSGFVIDKAGHVVTNYHVVDGADKVEVSFSDQESTKARVVGADPSTDLAVLKVDAPARALTPLQLGDSDQLRVGDQVVAIGNPFGLERSVTQGIVSALQREIQSLDARFSIDHVIQTDAAINHGNSGGPLLNAHGAVIGVNSQIETGGGGDGNVGIGFAIPSNTIKTVVGQLIRSGRVDHAYLGIEGHEITPALARVFRLPVREGVLVASVAASSGAAVSGLRGGKTEVTLAGNTYRLGGDILTKADGVSLSSFAALRDLLATKRPGDRVTLEVIRGGTHRTLTVKLGRRPTSPSG